VAAQLAAQQQMVGTAAAAQEEALRTHAAAQQQAMAARLAALQLPQQSRQLQAEQRPPPVPYEQAVCMAASGERAVAVVAICSLCWDELPRAEMYTVDCASAHSFCIDCVRRMVEIAVKEGSRPSCPADAEEGKCGYLLTEREVAQVCGKGEVWERFKQLLLRIGLQSMHGCVGCPTPGCGNWLVVEAAEGERVRCPCEACGSSFCSLCRGPYHYGPWSCEKVQEFASTWAAWCLSSGRQQRIAEIEEEAFRQRAAYIKEKHLRFVADEQWKSKHLRHCPACNRLIQKVSGCDAMVCGQDAHGGNTQHGCGHKFRWTAAAQYEAKASDDVELDPIYGEEERKMARAGVRHPDFLKCDGCRREIVGWRFSCLHCPCFELCEDCEVSSGHDVSHVFRIVRDAADSELAAATALASGKVSPSPRKNSAEGELRGSAALDPVRAHLAALTALDVRPKDPAGEEEEEAKGVRGHLKKVRRWLRKKASRKDSEPEDWSPFEDPVW